MGIVIELLSKRKTDKRELATPRQVLFFDLIIVFYYPAAKIATGLFVFREILTLWVLKFFTEISLLMLILWKAFSAFYRLGYSEG